MVRLPALVCLLAAAAAAEGDPLAPFLRPDDARYRLLAHNVVTFGMLGPRAKLAARGFDAALYRAPPAVEGAVEQAGNIRRHLAPGFRFGERLAAKQRAVRRVLRRTPPHELVLGLHGFERWTPEAFAARFAAVVARERRLFPSQPIQALLRSERQFQEWLLLEVAARINELDPRRRAPALDVLIRGLQHGPPSFRISCAEVLGHLDEPMAASALERRFAGESLAAVRVAIVRARLRQGGPRLPSLLREYAGHESLAVRTEALRACRGMDRGWLMAMLRWRWSLERGRGRDEVLALWPEDLAKPALRKPVDFYGIRTASRRIAFCIDISYSMLFPMDGQGGTREPRLEKTRRELYKTLDGLPPEVEFTIVLFSGRVTMWKKKLVPATVANREAAVEYVEKRPVEPGTNVYDPIRAALDAGADTIFLLTDGEPNRGTVVDPALIVEAVADRNRYRNAVIHTIGLAQDQNAELLVNLAARTGGRYAASR